MDAVVTLTVNSPYGKDLSPEPARNAVPPFLLKREQKRGLNISVSRKGVTTRKQLISNAKELTQELAKWSPARNYMKQSKPHLNLMRIINNDI